ncbi:8407_t:CDS:2 [Ambispora gerdemannii]|uniref:Methylated-DNA--protein-cysteine methyltransferase n=1 Tax=Ambispora gerdemannii TaxID=144530 RepID=A0A9N9FQS8_9GLOM|nr:8407_t:CDS:2 [Ambispora gerdemannii]
MSNQQHNTKGKKAEMLTLKTRNFSPKVYNLCSQIPKGQVSTYKYIAEFLHISPREVGQILKINPFSSAEVPCHRVIATNFFIGGYYASKNEYEKLDQGQKDYQALCQEVSKEEQDFLLTEIKDFEEQKEKLIDKIKEQIIEEEGTKQNIVVEIRPGTGGTEAGLFARDLYRMYAKNEAGVHRVQRVPQTENKGRIHTSTASVVVLPEAQDIVLNIRPQDLKIETCRSSGAGGQHVNTTDSAVRVVHLPTGVVATSQDGRSQHANRERALMSDKQKETGNLRSSMIGTAERSEKIRTYNYPQNRVTDHRTGTS